MRIYFLKREIVSIYNSNILKRYLLDEILDLIFPTLISINIVI
jgi:hypothetical protein